MCGGSEERVVNTISSKELELSCLELIDLVEEKGCTFVITKDGKPNAKMMPLPPGAEPPEASRGTESILREINSGDRQNQEQQQVLRLRCAQDESAVVV